MKSAEEIQEDWWGSWWAADWSWDGLSAHLVGQNGNSIHGGAQGEKNLQEYWRRDLETGELRDVDFMRDTGEIISAPDKKLWHLAHVPLYWHDKTPAKAHWDTDQWAHLLSLVTDRIKAAKATETDALCGAKEPDLRAQLSGAILREAAWHPVFANEPLHFVCDSAAFLAWEGRRLRFGSGVSYKDCLFIGGVRFDEANFLGNICFDSAKFIRESRFTHSIFGGYARLVGADFLCRSRFDGVLFSEGAAFDQVKFVGNASFDGATFSKTTRFRRANFFAGASFENTTFSQNVRFNDAEFIHEANFNSSVFKGYASFDNVVFHRNVNFRGGEFEARTYFVQARFTEVPQSLERQPIGSFAERRFKDVADFSDAAFNREMDFEAAIFERLVRFDRIIFPTNPTLRQGIFNQAQFKDVVSFTGAGCRCFAAFDGAAFGAALQFDNIGEEATQHAFVEELAEARRLDGHHSRVAVLFSARIAARLSRAKSTKTKPDAALQHLERGCRVIKQAMEAASDKAREQMFYAFELTARRYQRDTSAAERLFSFAYALTANYGRSIARPLGCLAGTIPVFALLYWLIFQAQGAAADSAIIYQSLSLSLGRVFPFGLWPINTPAYQTEVLRLGDTGLSLALRLLATLQSLLTLVFAFLTGLALRRRFHIN